MLLALATDRVLPIRFFLYAVPSAFAGAQVSLGEISHEANPSYDLKQLLINDLF
jgi:hypothetical protein